MAWVFMWSKSTISKTDWGDDGVIKWQHFPRYWPFIRGIQRSPVDSPNKCQWSGGLMFSLICTWTNGRVNKWDDKDLGHHRAYFDVRVMSTWLSTHITDVYILSVSHDPDTFRMGTIQAARYAINHFRIVFQMLNVHRMCFVRLMPK